MGALSVHPPSHLSLHPSIPPSFHPSNCVAIYPSSPYPLFGQVYDLFDARLKDNLYLMFVVHASWWLKMTMNFVRTFVSQRFWDDKLIMLDSFADLFKRNYFAPGSLRMPDSPLVRKVRAAGWRDGGGWVGGWGACCAMCIALCNAL